MFIVSLLRTDFIVKDNLPTTFYQINLFNKLFFIILINAKKNIKFNKVHVSIFNAPIHEI